MTKRLPLILLLSWLGLSGCDYYEGVLDEDQGNNRDLFEYLVASGTPALKVSDIYDDFEADASNAYLNADQSYSGRYVIAIGMVLSADQQPWLVDQVSFWNSGADVELLLCEGGHVMLCSFPERIKALDEVEDDQIVAVVGLLQRSGSGDSLSLSLRRCEYVEVF
ncbi:MAG: hypothetical protein BWY87_00604 [Deltaproteobacteria bacterium ADurb.Bin510]|nr:MAG: hypothetical protein BWY87_00604 [Deltaproteobacteria bacterium ADurb.Bin510]